MALEAESPEVVACEWEIYDSNSFPCDPSALFSPPHCSSGVKGKAAPVPLKPRLSALCSWRQASGSPPEMSTLQCELLTGELSQQQKQLSVTAPLLLLGSLRGVEGGNPMGWHTEQGGRGSCLARPRGLSHVAQRSLQGTVPMPLCLQNVGPHGIRKLQ